MTRVNPSYFSSHLHKMVLGDLGKGINSALSRIFTNPEARLNEQALDEVLKDISRALLQADVNVKLVQSLRQAVKDRVQLDKQPPGVNKKRLIHKAVVDELCRMLDPTNHGASNTLFKPIKGHHAVIMFVGLQGAGKTTSVTKVGAYFSRKGFTVGLVCADTFRAGAYEQLKQNAIKAKLPFFGQTGDDLDPVPIVQAGCERFRSEGFDLVLVDTSGRHKQETALFDEMEQIKAACDPAHIVMVMDGAMGQAAADQAKAFHNRTPIGSLILTKMDHGNGKGGGALSACAAIGAPIWFVGTGEHVLDLELFSVQRFVSRMLGMGDLSGLMESVQDLQNPADQAALVENLQQGKFTLRDMANQLKTLVSLGPLTRVMSMIPGMNDAMSAIMAQGGPGADPGAVMKRFLYIVDSMAKTELDSDGHMFSPGAKIITKRASSKRKKNSTADSQIQASSIVTKESVESRIKRISKGSGSSSEQVRDFLTMYRKFAQLIKRIGGANLMNMMGGLGGQMPDLTSMLMEGGGFGAMPSPEMIRQIQQQSGRGGAIPDPNARKGFRQTRTRK